MTQNITSISCIGLLTNFCHLRILIIANFGLKEIEESLVDKNLNLKKKTDNHGIYIIKNNC